MIRGGEQGMVVAAIVIGILFVVAGFVYSLLPVEEED